MWLHPWHPLLSSRQRLRARWPLRLRRPRGRRRCRAGWYRRASGSESKSPARQARPRFQPCRRVRLVRAFVHRTRSCRHDRLPHYRQRREISRGRVDLAAAPAASRRAQLRNVRPIRRRCVRTCRRADRGRYPRSRYVRHSRKACAHQAASASNGPVLHDSRHRRCDRPSAGVPMAISAANNARSSRRKCRRRRLRGRSRSSKA